MLKIFGYVAGTAVVLLVLMFAVASTVSPERSAQLEKGRRIDAACEQMLADSALGSERRMTRQVCDQMKEKNGTGH